MNYPIAMLLLGMALAQSHPQTHRDGVNDRGDHAMGFSHERTKHQFIPAKDGGVIEVVVNDAKDTESRDQIQMHLARIAKLFSESDFDVPMFIHDQNPPGVPVMKRLHAEIQYRFEKTRSGGRVRITTKNAEAIGAIHEFLKFQNREHN
jgi:hypothetical protein